MREVGRDIVSSPNLSHAADLLDMNRMPTQRSVLRSLLRGKRTCREITAEGKVSRNAINIALFQLAKKGIVRRVRRGVYEPEVRLICLALMDQIEELERRPKHLFYTHLTEE